jgi:hypothetical protein
VVTAQRSGEIDVDAADVGPAQVVDRDRVGAAECVEVDVLDAAGIHGDVAEVAEEAQPVAVGRQIDVLGEAGAVEQHRIGAVLPLDRVASVARIPDERVVARAHQRQVVPAVAVDRVVPVPAEQRLPAGAAGERVVSVSAGEERRDRIREDPIALVDAEGVVTTASVDDDRADLPPLEAEVGGTVVADVDLDGTRIAGPQAQRDLVVRVRADDGQETEPELRGRRPTCPAGSSSSSFRADDSMSAGDTGGRRLFRVRGNTAVTDGVFLSVKSYFSTCPCR